MEDFISDDLDEETTKPIVEWFDDSPWSVQFVPTAVAFTAGALFGAAVVLVAERWFRD